MLHAAGEEAGAAADNLPELAAFNPDVAEEEGKDPHDVGGSNDIRAHAECPAEILRS